MVSQTFGIGGMVMEKKNTFTVVALDRKGNGQSWRGFAKLKSGGMVSVKMVGSPPTTFPAVIDGSVTRVVEKAPLNEAQALRWKNLSPALSEIDLSDMM
jgi:hypothetical protein